MLTPRLSLLMLPALAALLSTAAFAQETPPPVPTAEELRRQVAAGDRRALARAITLVEKGRLEPGDFPRAGIHPIPVLGLTGTGGERVHRPAFVHADPG